MSCKQSTASTIAPFVAPGGFERTTDPPNQLTEAIVDCFEHQKGRGHIVIKYLSTWDGDRFFHVERWLHANRSVYRDTSFAAPTREAATKLVTEESNTVRSRGQPIH